MKQKLRSKRFSSEKNAKSFAKKVNGEFKDLREFPQRKSDFKVTYKKQSQKFWDYSDEWNEKNLDGSFAYNGASKDF